MIASYATDLSQFFRLHCREAALTMFATRTALGIRLLTDALIVKDVNYGLTFQPSFPNAYQMNVYDYKVHIDP